MVIAHVVSTYPPYKGGMGNVAAALVERTRARGYDVRVITPATVRPWVRFGNAAWCPGIRGALEAMQPDIVHLHWPFIGGVSAVLRWRLMDKRRRLVVQYHMDLVGSGLRGVVFFLYQFHVLPMLMAVADRVVCSSRDYAEHGTFAPFFSQFGERFAEIPLGVDTSRFAPHHGYADDLRIYGYADVAEGIRESVIRESICESVISALFVGGLDRAHAFKGLPVLLDAVARVSVARLTVVGDGDVRAQYEQQARALGIGDRVTFLGALPDDALPDAYRTADVLVLPSTARSEAFGLVLLEAMACGTPVIASDLPGVRTLVQTSEQRMTQNCTAVQNCVTGDAGGFLVPPGDIVALAERLRWCDAHRDVLRAMGARARMMVETRYDWDTITRQWCDVYQQLSV